MKVLNDNWENGEIKEESKNPQEKQKSPKNQTSKN